MVDKSGQAGTEISGKFRCALVALFVAWEDSNASATDLAELMSELFVCADARRNFESMQDNGHVLLLANKADGHAVKFADMSVSN